MRRLTWLLAALLVCGCDQKKPSNDADTEEEPDVTDVPDEDLISVSSADTLIPPDGSFYIPDDDGTSTTEFYGTTPQMFTITNISGSPVTLNRIIIEAAEGVEDEEFLLMETDAPDSSPLIVDDMILSPSGTFGFWIHFHPVTGGTREATIDITFETTRIWSFTVTGRGSPADVSFFSDGGPALHVVLGTPSTDEYSAGLAMDELGNSYIAGHATSIVDTSSEDILVARIAPDGALDWGKVWHSSHAEGHRDWIGHTGDGSYGGAADSIAYDDGHVYIAASTNATASNPESGNLALVLSIDTTTGDIAWDRVWTPVDVPSTASHAAAAHSLDLSTTTVYVTGTTGADTSTEHSHVFLLALDSATGGSILFQQAIDVSSTLDDIGYSVRVTSAGNAYVAGATGTQGFVLRLTGVDTASPALDWARQIDCGPVDALETDTSGDVYVSCDRSGSEFSILKLSRMDGSLVWAKTWAHVSSSSTSIPHVLHVTDTSVLAAGMVGTDGFDDAAGDGFILNLLPGTGDLDWATLYFTGPSAAEACTHRVKGLVIHDDSIYLTGHVVTGDSNSSRYFGYWYDAPGAASDYTPAVTDVTPDVFSMASGTSRDASTDRTWEDLPTTVETMNAWNKTSGEPPDADIFWQTIFI